MQHNEVTTFKKKKDKVRRARAFTLRAQGNTVQEVADILQISKAQASKDIAREIRENAPLPTSEQIILQVSTTAYYRKCLHPKVEQGNTSAVLASVKCLEHEAKLLNLLAPQELHLTGNIDFHATAQKLLTQIHHHTTTITPLPQNQKELQ